MNRRISWQASQGCLSHYPIKTYLVETFLFLDGTSHMPVLIPHVLVCQILKISASHKSQHVHFHYVESCPLLPKTVRSSKKERVWIVLRAVTSRLSLWPGKSRIEHRFVSGALTWSCGHLKRTLCRGGTFGLFRDTLATVSRDFLLPAH